MTNTDPVRRSDDSTGSTNSSPPLAMVWVDHWRAILFGTLFAVTLAGSIVSILPRSYRAGCLILVTPPRAAESLRVAPEPLHMRTAHSLANSDKVLERAIHLLIRQHEIVSSIVETLSAEESNSDVWRTIGQMGSEQAADLYEGSESDFEEVWEDLPPIHLLPGLLDLDTDLLRSLDPILLGKYLSSRIRTSLENMHQVEYQPVLQLEAEWDSPTGAALVAFAWSRSLIRTLKEQYVEPTRLLRDAVLKNYEEVSRQIEEVSQKIETIRKENRVAELTGEKERLLLDLFGTVERLTAREILPATSETAEEEPLLEVAKGISEEVRSIHRQVAPTESFLQEKVRLQEELHQAAVPAAGSREAMHDHQAKQQRLQTIEQEIQKGVATLGRIEETLFRTEARVQSLQADLELLEAQRDYLVRRGAFETRTVNYEEMLGVRLTSPPTPPRAPVSPVVWKSLLVSAIAGFALMLFLVFVSHSLLQIAPERFDTE